MGMGYGGGFAVVIDEKDVAKTTRKEFQAYQNAAKVFTDTDGDLGNFARDVDFGQPGDSVDAGIPAQVEAHKKLLAAYDALQKAFKRKTGITLYVGYHNADEEGDRYDEVDGLFWALEFSDCYPASKEFKKLRKGCKEECEIKHYVTLG